MTDTATKPQPALLAGTVITFCSVVFGGLGVTAGLGDNPTVATIAGVGMLVTAGANQALTYWVRGQVVPVADVGSYLDGDREPAHGPAASEVASKGLPDLPGEEPAPSTDDSDGGP